MTKSLIPASQKKQIFIVYASSDVELAESLQRLLDGRGYDAFYCRKTDRESGSAKEYRSFLANKLASADLVILLLSEAFQWSNYCQAEAGMTIALEKNHLPILIPPKNVKDIVTLSPVLEGFPAPSAGGRGPPRRLRRKSPRSGGQPSRGAAAAG
jgi:hypothetical protein